VTGSSDIPANSYVGIVNSPTSFGLSSSPTSNVPANALGTHVNQTITLKEKNCKVQGISIAGTNNLIEKVRITNGYGSFINSQESFWATLGTSTAATADATGIIRFCTFDTPWGDY